MGAYDLRIYKSWSARNLNASWVNNYVFDWDGTDIASSDVLTLVNAVGSFEKELHTNQVQFLHATFSTVLDEPTYTPESLRVLELQGTGNIGITEENMPLDLNITLKMKKLVGFGRSGTMFLRGALRTEDVVINSRGEAELASGSNFLNPGTISNAFGHINNLVDFNWIMKTHGMDKPDEAGTVIARNVLGVSPSGVVVNKRNHRYFDEFTRQERYAIREAKRIGGSVSFPPVVSTPPAGG